MATLVCPCARGGDLWGEFWWVGREYKWVYFDNDDTSDLHRAGHELSGVRNAPRAEGLEGNNFFRAPAITQR
jgi:hypothetical protein